ncbi:NPC intracellular cholesterol transporter 2-like [Littorina saxatilis]|uniref:MD-2-related lipid-recognition domain-containing protein n=1 Tax=Littorina saxatilis TaxID=31220 RepID=A0AAN9BFF2_9CAEN
MKVFFFFPLFACVFAEPVKFAPCDSKGQVVSVDVTPCNAEGSQPACKFSRGQNVTVTLHFTSGSEITAAKPVASAYIFGKQEPAPFTMEQDSCERFETACPLKPNVEHIYTTAVYVQPSFPKVRAVAQWEIHDQDDQMVVCFNVPVELV